MAIPVYLQQFKAAGIYRVVFDKSTVLGVDSEILRLVVGYSEKGPFNIPTYVTSVSDFKQLYGDVSKKLEKRGVFFHRLALQALSSGPILALNLKKFDGETVDGASINTDFNPSFNVIDEVKLNVEDIYDTSRFWELSADKLNNLVSTTGAVMDQYINICATNNSTTGATYFIRKASGSKVNGYNITVSDWYSDGTEMPDFLNSFKNSLISDFFAEVYVFKGKFTAAQVLASSTLKQYFEGQTVIENGNEVPAYDENGELKIKLRKYVTNAFGDPVDTLDALYNDETSNAIGHYVGCLIPYFTTKTGVYAALDILFNSDQDVHNLMMSFNVDSLEEDGTVHIDLSGRLSIVDSESGIATNSNLTLDNLFNGTATTTLLGNADSKVAIDRLSWTNNVVKTNSVTGELEAIIPYQMFDRKIVGTMVVSEISDVKDAYSITLMQIGEKNDTADKTQITFSEQTDLYETAYKLGAAYITNINNEKAIPVTKNGVTTYYALYSDKYGTRWNSGEAFIEKDVTTSKMIFNGEGPQKVITAIARIEKVGATAYGDSDMNLRATIVDVVVSTVSDYAGSGTDTSVYGSSITFIPENDNWDFEKYEGSDALISTKVENNDLFAFLQVGDCLLAADGETDRDGNGIVDGDENKADGFFDNVYVQELLTEKDEYGNITKYIIKFTGPVYEYTVGTTASVKYLVRVDRALNQEIGTMAPHYLNGYVYKNDKPADTGMWSKLQWQKFILSALTEYKGLRTGLLNKSDIDYRYIVDTFESYVDTEVKSVFSILAKEKQSAFAILNFPAVRTFVNCPYTSFVDSKGVFNVQYVVNGYNKKKAATTIFTLPSDSNGASFCAFYTPVKFSDGYVDAIVPTAGLISNLFMEKYKSRQPYYIIAGPNYGNISATNLVGPDYNYSQDELQIIEPFGVNCMVYRSQFGTFINANQTAKQTPVSALSKVNVRELVIYLQDEIEKVLQSYQWEFNNATTRNAILDKANSICARIAANGGIQAYLNVMDESNNTPEIIDNEMAILSTHIEPGMGCGKMVQELTLYRTGKLASSILE